MKRFGDRSARKPGGGYTDPVHDSIVSRTGEGGKFNSEDSDGEGQQPALNTNRVADILGGKPTLNGRGPGGHDDGKTRKEQNQTSLKNIEEIMMWVNHDPYKQPSGIRNRNFSQMPRNRKK